MLCTKPLIRLWDKKYIDKYSALFVSYKHFKEKKALSNLCKSGKVEMFPCRSCLACLNMSRYHWVKKLELEKLSWKYTYFITITYNDDNLPDELKVRDLQNFIKYLRKLIAPAKLRYFGAGEYGNKTKRPHYHIIIFTDYEFSLSYLKSTKSGLLYSCELMEKAWKHKGYIWVAFDFNSASFAYVATYSNKNFLKQYQNQIVKDFNYCKNTIYSNDELSGFNKYVIVDSLVSNIIFSKSEFLIFSKKPPLGSMQKSIKSPSSLLKWLDKENDKKYIDRYETNADGKKYAIWKAIEYEKSIWLKELEKRKKEYDVFLKNNDLYNTIETNNILKNNKQNKNNKL
nr:MAG: replication initiation protein [Microvirus Sku126]